MTYTYPTAFSSWGQEEYQAMHRVIASGKFTMGEEVRAFEREFADYHGMKHGIMTNSGSSANLVAVAVAIEARQLMCMGNSEVWLPAIAWSTTYAPFAQLGFDIAKVVDVDDTWNADWSVLKPDCCPPVVVVCPILGNPVNEAPLREFADSEEGDFLLIADCCESLGARYDGKLAGTQAHMATYSFFYSHQLSAIEGGMILTNDDELADLCRMIRAHGWTRDIKTPMTFADEYDFRMFGFNVRPLEMHAAIAREQLKKLDGFIEARSHQWGYFQRASDLRNLPVRFPRLDEKAEISPFGIQFQVKNSETRSQLVAAFRANGIDCRLPTGGSFTKHEYGKPWSNQATPKADEIHETGLFIGLAPYPRYDDLDRAIKIMKETL